MGSSAANTTSTRTDTITTTNNPTVVTTVNKGTDAVALANALSGGLAQNLALLTAEQTSLAATAGAGLQTLAAGSVAQGNGSELMTPYGASTVSPQAQAMGTLSTPIILAAAIIAAVLLWRK